MRRKMTMLMLAALLALMLSGAAGEEALPAPATEDTATDVMANTLPAPATEDTATDVMANTLPAPAEDLSFLAEYVDAARVGEWYLACAGRTGEGRYEDATRNKTAEWRLLDADGNVLADGLRWWPEEVAWPLHPRPFEGFEDGADAAVLRVGQKYGLIDREGRIVAEPVYDEIFGFESGDTSAPAMKDGRWGCVDAAGREVVPFIYDESFARFEGGVTVARRGGKACLLGADGTELLPPEYDSVWLDAGAQYGMARRGGTVAVFDLAGNILFERELGADGWVYCYADAEPPFAYNDGEGRWGYLNPDGSEALDGPFEDAFPFRKGSDTAAVRVAGGKWGRVRRDGSFAVAPKFDWIGSFSDGLAQAERDGLYGFVDADGATAIPFAYSRVDDFTNGFADASPAEDEALHGLIDRAGEWVIAPEYGGPITVGADGVAVMCEWEDRAYFRMTEDGAEPIDALPERPALDGCFPNEAGGNLARLDGAATLSKRVSKDRLPHLDGPARLYPVFAAFVQAIYPKDTTAYRGWNDYRNDGDPTLTWNDAEAAWERLSEGDADVIFVPAPDGDDSIWATLAARGQVPEFTPLFKEALVFPAHADNPVEGVTSEQLRRIFTGKLTRWDDLGAAGLGEIAAYFADPQRRDADAAALYGALGVREDDVVALEGVVGYDGWNPMPYMARAGYRNLPNAVGCAPRFACRALLGGGAAKLLAVDGVAPTDENIAGGTYPFAETIYAVRLVGNDNPNVLALLEWIQSEQGAELIEKTGYVAIAGR